METADEGGGGIAILFRPEVWKGAGDPGLLLVVYDVGDKALLSAVLILAPILRGVYSVG